MTDNTQAEADELTDVALIDAEQRKELIEKLTDTGAVESVQYFTMREGDDNAPTLAINLIVDEIPTVVMRILSDAGLSVIPKPDNTILAQPEESGVVFAFEPSIWNLIIEQKEFIDELLNNPIELTKMADKLASQNEGAWSDYGTATEVVEDIQGHQQLLDIILGGLTDETREALTEYEGEPPEDLSDGAEIETFYGGSFAFGILPEQEGSHNE